MVTFNIRFTALVAYTVLSVAALSAKDLASYKLGDRAEEDIITPVALDVVDPVATAELKKQEDDSVPAVMRFYPEAVEQAVKSFHDSFTKTRGDFLDAVEQGFDRRKLAPGEMASEQFMRLLALFQKKNQSFPMTTNLARLWAAGQSDQAFEAPLLESLRNEMSLFIRATNTISEGARLGGTVRVVSCDMDETLTEQMIARHGRNHPRTDFVSCQRAKSDLQNAFPAEERATGKFVATFIRPNCFVDEELTIVMRARRTESLSVSQEFPAGSLIARRGDFIGEKTLVALMALNQKAAVEKLHALTTNNGSAPDPEANRRIIGFVAAVCSIVLLVATVFWFFRRRASSVLAPAPLEVSHFTRPHPLLTEDSWQERALAAELRAEKAQAVIRQGLIANLARWMSDTLVQRLLLQRAHLIEAQQRAVSEVDRLGQRLETIHSRMSDRLMAYEQRIAELEKELDTKDEINRELIKAEIETIRRKIEAEQVKADGGLN